MRLGASLIDPKMGLGGPRPIGETAGIERFHSRHAFARHSGTAPLPVWFANTHRHRLSRAGNRQLNAAVHRIALTRASNHPPARRFLGRRTANGNTHKERPSEPSNADSSTSSTAHSSPTPTAFSAHNA